MREMVRKHVLGEVECDHCHKKITTVGETTYYVSTHVHAIKIGEDLDAYYEAEHTPTQEIDSDLCFNCYRDLEQVLQNGKK
jgi:hypothetical protein